MQPLSAGDPHEIGPYRVVGRLGAGGMGLVYAGVDSAGRRVAIKLVHEALSTDLEFRRRFSREISVLTEVDGACVARVLGSDSGTERPWLATEFIPGPTLEQHVRAEGPLTGDALYGLAAGLAEALVAMHAVDVVHRDLKPTNVILSPQGPRLIDFGIAKVLDGTAMTHTGTLIGSPGWISPEEYGEGPAGTPADVYGWAMLVLFAVTGEPPYGTGRPEVLAYKVREEIPDLEAVPEGLRELVGRALGKDPDKRPAADDVLAAVTETWRGEEGEREPAVPDITSLIQRTWLMPQEETADWLEPADAAALPPAAQATGPAALVSSATPTGPVALRVPGALQVPGAGQVMVVAKRHGSSWFHAYAVTAAAVTAIAVTAIIVNSASERSTPVAAPTALHPVRASTATTPIPAPMKTALKKPRFTGKAVSFKGIRMTLPKDWRLLRIRRDLACLESPNARGESGPWEFACRPDSLIIRTGSGADRWPGSSLDDPVSGWVLGDPMPCLTGGKVWRDWSGTYGNDFGAYGFYVAAYNATLARSSLAKMADGRKAAYREWRVTCANNDQYTMKIWHLPLSKVSLFVLSARPEDSKGYKQIIASTDLLGYKHAAKL